MTNLCIPPALLLSVMATGGLVATTPAANDLATGRAMLCVTEGSIDEHPGGRPVGLRSDNARLELSLTAGPPAIHEPRQVLPCRAGIDALKDNDDENSRRTLGFIPTRVKP